MFKKKAKNPDKMGLLNLFKWQSSQVSTACNVLILGYFNIFCTDTLLLDPLIMGILMVVSQVVSAVATPIPRSAAAARLSWPRSACGSAPG